MLRNTNNKIIAIALLFAFLLLLGGGTSYALSEPNSSRSASVLYEPHTGVFLHEQNADVRLPMASTTKIMTALVAIERGNLADIVTVDSRAVGVEGSSAYLRDGTVLSLGDLLYALMLQSANDAAEAIAYFIAGGIDEFSLLMNQKAEAIGLENTNFTNPHGLDDENHYTTARDLAIITAEALRYPEFAQITATRVKKIEKEGFSRTFVNHNKLLSQYEGCIGVKTGFTKRSGRCLVSAAERDGLRLIAVTLNEPNDWSVHRRLLDSGFEQMEAITLVSRDSFGIELPILGADTPSVALGITEDLRLIRKRGDALPRVEIDLPRFITAPIKKGDVVGKIRVIEDGVAVLLEDIVALTDVNQKRKKGLLDLF